MRYSYVRKGRTDLRYVYLLLEYASLNTTEIYTQVAITGFYQIKYPLDLGK
ncbi:hypothetical protein C7460_12281 [Marinoscillum furvescens DSM 4134]|uniref:Phage integrase family protein n=1 Tax=Marinoscillum furvescens DSM 4134 TaxID=1122208 RepID=A0A3D9L008_MARFU|nr:hypothetical protein C7460_12281 [Marinoscillum furvescens DSM 4134]